jgi:putative protein kinase ArgK-like GTPase of G3E family
MSIDGGLQRMVYNMRAGMAKKQAESGRTCKACGFPMILDETVVQGQGSTRIKRTFFHCVNGQCGHIDRVGDYLLEAPAN